MIKIYDINDKLLMQAEVTSEAKREQEMSKSDYISLSFSAAEKVILPAGAYINYTYKIDTVREVTRKFLLLESYEPIQSDECSWKYTPQFQHPKMILSKTPFFIYTRNSQNVEVKQNVWSFVGTTSALSGRIADFLNKDLMFGECGWKVIFQKVTANTINVSFSDNDFISALTAITNAIGDNCEWHIDYDDEIIYIGKVLVGAIPVILEVGKNVGVPSINESKEGYYNAFSIFGGTRNITQVNSKGENVSSGDIRLQLDEGNGTITIDGKECSYSIDKYSTLDLRADKTKEPLFVKVLDLSQIYPSLNTYVYNVRGRVKYVLDENKKKIPISYNADGSVKEYKTFTVWYMRLAYPTTEKVAGKTIINTTVDDGVTHYWYNFEVTDDLLINGKNIGCSFEANFNTGALSTPLAGRGTNGDYVGFELIYHKEASSSHTSDDVSKDNFSVLAGDYEIIYQQDNEVIIPTNKEEMLIPRGENKPSLKCNITVLYNIAMANTIYYEDAQNRLLEKAKEEIVRLLSDLNNYEVKSYSDVFLEENPQLQIGQSVTYKDGHGYELATRVLKLSTNIDYDFIQSITLGNQAIKGTITQLKEDVQTIIANGGNSGNGGGFSVSQLRSLIAKYGSDNFISKQFDDIAHGTITWEKIQKLLSGLLVGGFNNENGGSWTPDAEGRSHLITDYLEVRMKAIFEELAIKKNSTIGGKEIISPAGGVAAYKVDEVTVTYNDVSQKAYRCYFLAEQDGDEVDNDFVVEDQVRSESFNLNAGKYHKTGNHFFWRMVIGIDEEPVELEGKKYHYIDLSDTDCATASDVPAKGDVLSQCGNRTDVERQNCLIFSAVDTYSSSISLYHGINSYSFANKEFVEYGVDKSGDKPKAFFRSYGDAYIGDRPTKDNNYEGDSYVKYDSEQKKVIIKAELSVKSTLQGNTLEETFKDIQKQFDRKAETWYQAEDPSIAWETDLEKSEHKGDLWYNTTNGETSYWNGSSWQKQDIPDAVFDMIDGKSSIYVSKPSSYEECDLWILEAAYTLGGVAYTKGELVTAIRSNTTFNAADWTKKVIYTDDTEAKKAQASIKETQTNLTNLGNTVKSNRDAFDKFTEDGYLDSSEIAAIAQDSKRLEDAFAAAEKSYNEVANSDVLSGTSQLTDLKAAFGTDTTGLLGAKKELIAYIADIVTRYNAADSDGKKNINSRVATLYDNFQAAYDTFYNKLGLASAYITSTIIGKLNAVIGDVATYNYLKEALSENASTDINGGLILSSLIALRDPKTGYVQSGINGIVDNTAKGNGIATWWGGYMNDGQVVGFDDKGDVTKNAATSLIRFDGSGYLANGAIYWGVDGKVHADPTSFIISEKNLGAYLAFFEPTWKSGSDGSSIKDLVALTPQAPFKTLTVSNDLSVEGKLKIGSITLSVVNGALKIDGNVYSTGGMSAYGEGTSNGGGLNGSIVPFDKAKSLTAQNEGTEIASAWSIKKLYDMINSIDVTGQLADYLKKTEASTLYQPKGNYLTSHQDISGKSDKTHTHSVKINGVTKTIAATGGTAVDLGTYLTSHQSLAAYLKSADAEKTYSKLGHTHAFSEITGKPTTLAGYGVTDGVNAVSVTGNGNAVTSASIDGHTLTLTKGSTFSLSGHTHTFASLTSKPTTIAGYGITDAYTKAQVDSTIAKYLPLAGGTITGALTVNGIATFKSKVAIGDIYIINDGSGNLYVQKTDGKTAANFYATGGITAFGASSVSGGPGSGLNGSVLGFEKAAAMTSADNGDSSKTEVSFLATAWSIKQLNDKINAFGTGVFSDYLTIAAAKATYQPKGSYLTSHQTIYGLTIQKNGTSLGTYTPNSAAKTINVTVPTKLSELSNDSGYTKNTGTVTSVAISVPTGLSVSGSPITTNGTIAIALASGYSIPTTAKQTAWDGAVSAKHTHSNKSVLDGISSTKVSHWNSAYDWYALMTTDEETADGIINKWNEVVSFLANIAQTDTLSGIVDGINKSISDEVARAKKAEGVNASGISANKGSIATLQGYFTNGSAKKALQLTNARKLWGNSFNGTADINGSIIVPSGKYISIGNIKLEYDAANKALKITNTTTNEVANLYTSGGVSAYGVGTSSSSGGGLNGSVESYSDALKLTSESLSEVASAYSIKALDSRISSLEGGSATAISVSGSGNAVTSVTKNGTTISIVKGSTFLTNHQSLDGYVNAISVSGSGNAITSVSKSGKGITFTKGATFLTSHQSLANYYTKSSVDSLLSGKSATSHTHSVKINGITKTIAASGGDAVDLGTYLTAHQSLAAYATQNWVKNEATAHNADMVDNYHASGLFTGFSISDVANKVTISIGGTSKTLNLVRAFPSGVGNNFNDIATHGNSMGMSNIAAPYASSTANYQTLNGYVNPNGQTGWHHYINLSYTDSNNTATSPNMWQTQFAIKAGTTEVYVRSRAGGKISNDAAWAAPWVRLARVTDNVASASKVANALSWSGYSSGSYNGSAVKSISIPNNTNQLTNGAGFITASASITGNAATATKVNHSLSVFGKSFNGSADVTVADTDLITSISTATANLTDKTEILTSYASDNGFNDSNAKNRIYRRPASAIWGYINSKTISNADKLDNVHLNGIFTALSNTNNGVSMTIGTVAKSLANMQVYSATKLVTARNIALNGDLTGNANFDGSANITINGYMSYCNATVGNTNTYPWRRIAKVNELTDNYSDGCILLYISEGFIGGSYGIARVYIRTDNLSTGANASCSIQWISRNGYGLDSLKIAMYKTTGKAYYDVFLKMRGAHASVVIRTLQDQRGGLGKRFTLVNSTETTNAASHTEAYATIEDAATAIHNRAYTSIAQGSDVAMVHNADMVDGIHASGLFTNLSNSGNSLSITVGGTNKTLTVNYASNAGNADTVDGVHASGLFTNLSNSGNNISITIGGTNKTLTAAYATNCDTVDGYHAQSGSSKPYGKIPVIGTDGVIELGHCIDFHHDNTTGSDYSVRLHTNGNHGNVVTLPTATGTLALTSDNVASATKLQTARTIWGQSFNGTANVSGALSGATTISASNTISTSLQNGALKIGNKSAPISAIDAQVIFNTGAAVRFGETAWDWDQWAGLKYTHSNKTVYLGIADGSVFNARNAQSGGKLQLKAIDRILFDSDSDSFQIHCDNSNDYLRIGSSGNSGYVLVSDIGNWDTDDNGDDTNNWLISIDGTGTFKSIYCPSIYTANSIISTRNKALLLSGNVIREYHRDGSPYYSSITFNETTLDLSAYGNIGLTSSHGITIEGGSGTISMVASGGFDVTYCAASLSVSQTGDSEYTWTFNNGSIKTTGGITAYQSSDERLKHNIHGVDSLAIIKAMGGTVAFRYNEDDKASIGWIAQRVLHNTLMQDLVEKDEDGYLKINYWSPKLIAVAFGAIEQVDDEVAKLKARVRELENEVEQLKSDRL